jgi:hypothetical protein
MLVHAQGALYAQQSGLPEVFLIGEHEDQYLTLAQEHPGSFMALYNNDINLAYRSWSEFLMDIEDYATEMDFDLKGVKLWLNIYFDADGTISNLAFFPKPNSRNVPDEHLVAFFKTFIRQYHLTVTAEIGFQHSASASFPTFFHRTNPETARNN